jgi:dethiobiotin synthetase
MGDIVVITGTGTEVGKTWATARVAASLKESGLNVSVRKPVQSFAPGEGPTDAEVLAAAVGEEPASVCPAARSYALALAPPIAADRLGLPRIELKDLIGELQPPSDGLLLVEGVGGPRSPLAHDGDTVDLFRGLGADAWILISDAGLGAINSILLSLAAFGTDPIGILLNRFDPRDEVHVLNREWLVSRLDCPIVVDVSELASLVRTFRRKRLEAG